MIAAATLVDARTGAVIISIVAIDNARHETDEGKLVASYGQAYREWLTHGA
jgi:hypothetical protein